MGKLPLVMIAEINSLQRMDVGALHAKYGELVPDLAKCRKCEILRAEIAYRLQERFYGISVPEATKAKLVANGDDRTPGNGLPLAGTRLVREWKGVTHEVIVRDDGVDGYGAGRYRARSAVARKITGTKWNGRIFFGLKK